MGREIGERVGSALRTLPERQRAVFVLRHYQELSLEEIAHDPRHEPGHGEERAASRGRADARAAAGSAAVILGHGRWRRRIALLAAGVLDEAESGPRARSRRGLRGLRA